MVFGIKMDMAFRTFLIAIAVFEGIMLEGNVAVDFLFGFFSPGLGQEAFFAFVEFGSHFGKSLIPPILRVKRESGDFEAKVGETDEESRRKIFNDDVVAAVLQKTGELSAGLEDRKSDV